MKSVDQSSSVRSPQWWAGITVGVLSTLVAAALVFFTAPYLLVLVLAWPLLFTLATMTLDRPAFTRGAFTSLFVVLAIAVVTLGISLLI